MPEPLGHAVSIHAFVDANHAGNVVTRRSHSGIIIFVNNAPILYIYSNHSYGSYDSRYAPYDNRNDYRNDYRGGGRDGGRGGGGRYGGRGGRGGGRDGGRGGRGNHSSGRQVAEVNQAPSHDNEDGQGHDDSHYNNDDYHYNNGWNQY